MDDQRRANHADAKDALTMRSAMITQFLGEDRLLDVRRAQAAIFLGPGGSYPAACRKLLIEVLGEIEIVVSELRRGSLPVGWQMLPEKVPNFGSEGLFLRGEAKIHVRTPRPGRFPASKPVIVPSVYV